MNSHEISAQAVAPQFPESISGLIKNYKTEELYAFLGGTSVVFTDEDVQRLVEICSQSEIYDMLFRWRMQGKPYTIENAQWFVNSLKQGWENNTHFIFIIRNVAGSIVGAMDIKSADTDRAEVGYWADRDSGGFVTNALIEMCNLAKNAGYKKLYAKVVVGNTKSENVLKRAGFEVSGTETAGERNYTVFEKVL